jgi:hypothetical protein
MISISPAESITFFFVWIWHRDQEDWRPWAVWKVIQNNIRYILAAERLIVFLLNFLGFFWEKMISWWLESVARKDRESKQSLHGLYVCCCNV